jgi:hypothetical protein
MAESVIKSYFPSQVAPDIEKISLEFGGKVGKAIEWEWFKEESGTNRYKSNQSTFHTRRLYARGEQSIQKYKDELAVNGDLSYLNLDWKQVPIIPKFVDIVVNGISDRLFKLKAESQDPLGLKKRTEYMDSLMRDMQTKELTTFAAEAFGVNLAENDPNDLPENMDELELRMQMSYKQDAEQAEEIALRNVFSTNDFDSTRKRVIYDLVVIGIGATRNIFSKSESIKIEYVDPASLVYSYTEDPYFDDLYYIGEVKTLHINELVKQFPHLTDEDLEKITKTGVQKNGSYTSLSDDQNNLDTNSVQVLYFNYKTYMNEIYKVKELATGAEKIILKDATYNPDPEMEAERNISRLQVPKEVLFEGAMILGTEIMLKWELAKNMIRPKSNYNKVRMNYNICAPRMYRGRIESTVGRVMGFADNIQLVHLKLQQVAARVVPDGIYLDADGLAEIDLGNGTEYNPAEALNMFFQTGSVVGRSYTMDGELNHAKIPIQEIQSSSGGNKIQSLINLYNFNLQMIRDATGLNEARDASTPSPDALVGVQKLAAANSNTATRHILEGMIHIVLGTAYGVSMRISDVLEYSPTREDFIRSMGVFNTAILSELSELHLRDFAISLELEPDEEEKQMLEQNIQVALARNLIDLDDAIDIREIKNLKLANKYLKLSKRKKQERDMKLKEAETQMMTQSQMQIQQAAAQAEAQKQQAIAQAQIGIKQFEEGADIRKLQAEAKLKKELMQFEFDLNMQLESQKQKTQMNADIAKEDRKASKQKEIDNRKGTIQSELTDQKLKNKGPKNFESANNDVISGDFDLGSFEPK